MTLESNADTPELLALRAEMDHEPAADARRRVLSRLERSLPGLAAATATSLVTSDVAAKVPQGAAPLALPAKVWLLGAFALGGAAGAVTHSVLEAPPAPRVVYVDRLVHVPATAPVRAEPPLSPAPDLPIVVAPEHQRTKRGSLPQSTRAPENPAFEAPTSPEPPARTEPSESTAESSNSAGLAEQQALLDQARAALGRSDGRTALERLGRHGARFPESVLAEEREALAVKALVTLGNVTEARARLDAFERRFPRSPLLPSLRSITADAVTEPRRPGQ